MRRAERFIKIPGSKGLYPSELAQKWEKKENGKLKEEKRMRENRTTRLWNEGWSFLKTQLDTSFEEIQNRQQEFRPVELPHDYLIYDAKNLYEDSFGWYRKEFLMHPVKGEHYFLEFGGVYMNSTLYINGVAVGDWKYGYSSFEMDITEFVKEGVNEAVVLVRHQSPNSRWYSGAGIYRDVYFRSCKPCYLPTNGTYVHMEQKDKGYEMQLETEYVSASNQATLRYTLLDREGKEQLVHRVESLEHTVSDGSKGYSKANACVFVRAPHLWDLENPYCYTLKVELFCGQDLVDEQGITLGFRTYAYDPDKGMSLNGQYVKLHGVCEHHDLGCLGSAVNKTALRRQFEILKTMGVNALRTSHNMPDEAFMDLADEMGFAVLSEAFDMWERPKTTYDYARFFVDWAGRDVESWIRRDRNHPSVFMWSIGNEIYDTHADDHGQEITRRLIGYVREHDPKENAPITIGSNYMPWEGAQKCADIVKYVGYNYGEKYYEEHHREHPDWIIYGSETASVVQSRGIYHFPLSQSILSDEDEQCSALGNSATSWGAKSTTHCIVDDRDAKFTFGQFIWTGFDYIGEPTPYHTKNSYFGQIDTAGYPKDPYYLFQAEWTDVNKAPMVHLYPYWDFNPGQMIDVCAVSNASQVELFVNGRSQGVKDIDHEKGTTLVQSWQVPYEPGVIEAVAYESGKEVARERRESFGDSEAIRLSCDRDSLEADAKDLAFVTIEMLDKDGKLVENAVDNVTVQMEGPGRLLGLDNGDSTDYDDYKGNTRKLFSGKLLAVIASTTEAGEMKVKVSGKGVKSAELRIESRLPAEEKGKFTETDVQGQAVNPHGYLENLAEKITESCTTLPVRKIELITEGSPILTADHKSVQVKAVCHPAKTSVVTLVWKVVSDAGIDVPYATITPLAETGEEILLTACSDGEFRLRCMAKDENGKVTVISQLECRAEGIGTCFYNPYEFLSAGLYSYSFGEIGNGNEKGISTARDGVSGVAFEQVDFGEYGSDTITLPVFALSGEEYPIEVWNGKPYTEGAVLVDTVIYQKTMIWNTYQAMTFKLSSRFKGVCTIGFAMRDQKVHIKGFSFEKQEKAFGRLTGGECDKVYGDSFERVGDKIEGIGNNVTIEYGNMDFGEKAAYGILLCGHTPLAGNTVHIRFHHEDGTSENRMVEFVHTEGYAEQKFEIEPLQGKGCIDLVFLPGSAFDLAWIQFI